MNIILFTPKDKTKDSLHFFIAEQDERAKHLLKILHKKTGDSFEAGIENGNAGVAKIITICANENPGLLCTFTPITDGQPLYPLEMIIGFPRPIQLKRMFRDMASLGVSKIHLCGTELGEKSYLDSKIIERGTAYTLLKDGTIQAKSTHVPELYTYRSVCNCLEALDFLSDSTTDTNTNFRIALDNINATTSLSTFLRTLMPSQQKPRVFASIGSERGWTNTERKMFETAGFTRCSMGSRVLRTETAATVAATVILENIFNII